MRLAVLMLLLLASPAWAQQGAALAGACQGCHGEAGRGTAMPTLAGHGREELLAMLKAFREETRPATVMTRIARGFTEAELAEIAAYYAKP